MLHITILDQEGKFGLKIWICNHTVLHETQCNKSDMNKVVTGLYNNVPKICQILKGKQVGKFRFLASFASNDVSQYFGCTTQNLQSIT